PSPASGGGDWRRNRSSDDKPVRGVVGGGGRIAVGGIAPAAAAAGFKHEAVAGADNQAGFLGFDRARRLVAGIERVAVRQPVLAAEDAAGAMPDPVAGGVADRRLGGLDDHVDDAAGTAAVLPGAP